jgi:hypothetical protein
LRAPSGHRRHRREADGEVHRDDDRADLLGELARSYISSMEAAVTFM